MTTERDMRFWTTEHLGVDATFMHLIEAASAWSPLIDQWQGIKIVEHTIHNVVLTINEPLSSVALGHIVRGYDRPTYRIVTGRGFTCWRFAGLQATPGFLRLQLESWGTTYAQRHGRDIHMEGDAAISIQQVGPYCMLLDAAETPAVRAVNQRVEENLAALTDLLFRCIATLHPSAVKVFVDAADYLPFNAHLAYYRSEDVIMDDIVFISEVWEHGLPAYRITPLKQLEPGTSATVFHPWRSVTAQQTLKQQLALGLPQVPHVTPTVIQQVLASGAFDTYTLPRGVMVLEYPDFMNAFIDRFYLAVLNVHALQ